MLRGQVRLGRVFGVDIGLHFSWFFIAGLLTVSLGAHLFSVNPDWSAVVVWTAAVVTAMAFFAAILLHELAHAAVARSRGVPPYVIFHDTTLRELARLRPTTLDELHGVKGIGARKAEDLGEAVLGVIRGGK